jgi:hypothetical protein
MFSWPLGYLAMKLLVHESLPIKELLHQIWPPAPTKKGRARAVMPKALECYKPSTYAPRMPDFCVTLPSVARPSVAQPSYADAELDTCIDELLDSIG